MDNADRKNRKRAAIYDQTCECEQCDDMADDQALNN